LRRGARVRDSLRKDSRPTKRKDKSLSKGFEISFSQRFVWEEKLAAEMTVGPMAATGENGWDSQPTEGLSRNINQATAVVA
jgi:hypothetical protein